MTPLDDWSSPGFVAHYNGLYGMSPAEALAIIEPLQLGREDRFVDYGCGNGLFLALARPRTAGAVGVDSSPEQIKLARENLAGVPGVELVEMDLLRFAQEWGGAAGFTKAFSRKALHHLDDAQKGSFFQGASRQLDRGALFLVEDAVFDFDKAELEARMPQVEREAQAFFGNLWPRKRADVLRTLANEFPTGWRQWEAALRQGGFDIVRRWQKTCFYGAILARNDRS